MKVKICPSCGHKHDIEDISCPYCKHSYNGERVVCKNCGAYLKPRDKVCYVCESVIEEPNTQEKPVEPQQEIVREVSCQTTVAKPKRHAKAVTVIWVLALVVVSVVTLGACYYKGIINRDVFDKITDYIISFMS